MKISLRTFLSILSLLPLLLSIATAAPGDDNWDLAFGPPGVSGEVTAMTVAGDDIYVGGNFIRAGSISANHIARWNTTTHQWFPLGDGVDGPVMAIAVRGDSVYVGGQFSYAGNIFTRNIAIYNSATNNWGIWGGGGAGGGFFGYVAAIAISGSNIYAAGNFSAIGTTLANNIAQWDGVKWHRMNIGVNSDAYALVVDGGDLYVGGNFTTAGPADAGHIARWDGSNWSALGAGTSGPVHALTLSGRDLYVGGAFTKAGDSGANNIARFTIPTSRWSPLGNGVRHFDITLRPVVNAIAVSGSDIYIGGDFRRAGSEGEITRHLARWNGTDWTSRFLPSDGNVGKGIGSANFGYAVVNALLIYDGEAYIGGRFDSAYMQVSYPNPHGDGVHDPYVAFNIVRWDISRSIWHSLGDGDNGPPVALYPSIGDPLVNPFHDGAVTATAVSGHDVYIGGHFTTAGGVIANNIARWNSLTRRWSALDSGFGSRYTTVRALAIDDSDLYAAVYTIEVEDSTNTFECYVARWDRATGRWRMLGDRFSSLSLFALAVRGDTLYAGGKGSGTYAGGLARWNGTAWSPVGGGGTRVINAIAVGDDGVYVGGVFTGNIARWEESTGSWSALGSGFNGAVNALTIDRGSLYAGGEFTEAGGIEVNHIAVWNGESGRWSGLGDGLRWGVRPGVTVNTIAAMNGRIYAGGTFSTAGDVAAGNIAEWDGESWRALGSGTDGTVRSIAVDPIHLIAVGSFTFAGSKPAYHIARWTDATASLAAASPRQQGALLLEGIVPNPFVSGTTIRFRIPSEEKTFHTLPLADAATVRLSIHDALGRHLATLLEGRIEPGEHVVRWEAAGIPSGVYYCRLQYGSQIETREMILAR
jgi:hypothetical protein